MKMLVHLTLKSDMDGSFDGIEIFIDDNGKIEGVKKFRDAKSADVMLRFLAQKFSLSPVYCG